MAAFPCELLSSGSDKSQGKSVIISCGSRDVPFTLQRGRGVRGDLEER